MKNRGLQFLSRWRVPIACSVIMLNHFGIWRLAPLLFVESIEYYDTDRNLASLPHVLRLSICHLTAPVASFFSCKFGLEKMILIGCSLSSLAMGSCFFAANILTVAFCWGILSGIGLGMCVNLLLAVVSYNCGRNTATANGIVVSGASVGAYVYLPICEILIDKFGLSGTFLILSAMTLNAIPAAMLLLFSRSSKNKTDTTEDGTSATYSDKNVSQVVKSNVHAEDNFCSGNSFVITKEIQITSHSKCIATVAERSQEQNTSPQLHHSKIDAKNLQNTRSADGSYDSATVNLNSRSISPCNSDVSERSYVKNNLLLVECFKESAAEKDSEICLRNLEVNKQEIAINVQNITNLKYADEEIMIVKSENTSDSLPVKLRKYEDTMKGWSKFSILYDPLFLLLSFIQSSYLSTVTMQGTTLAEYVLDRGFQTSDATFLLLCAAPMDIGGRLSLGWVTDCGLMSVPNFCALLFFCYGICYTAFTLCKEMVGLTIMYALLTFFMGTLMALLPILMSLNFKGDRKIMALSSVSFVYVPMSFGISPLIEYMRGSLGSYEYMYYLLAGICVLCTTLIFLISNVRVCSRKMNNET